MNQFIKHKIDTNGICSIKINRDPVNALSFDLLKELHDLFLKLNNDENIRLVIIRSSIKHFSAGADLKERKIMSEDDSLDSLYSKLVEGKQWK